MAGFGLVILAFLFTLWAQFKVKGTYAKYAKVGTHRGITGAQVAELILRDADIELSNDPLRHPGPACGLQAIPGHLTDHYDPRSKTLGLSEEVYMGRSVAALGIAAHEVGHAIQHARMYSPLMLRNVVYPLCNVGSTLAWPLFIGGWFFSMPPLLYVGIILYMLAVFFTVLTLPVEFNASRRAMAHLREGGYLDPDELRGARKVLTAAAMTYLAAAAMAAAQLLRMILIANRR